MNINIHFLKDGISPDKATEFVSEILKTEQTGLKTRHYAAYMKENIYIYNRSSKNTETFYVTKNG